MRKEPDIVRSSKLFALDSDNHLWLLKRPASASYRPETWDLIGGGLDRGESYIAAAIREAKEETDNALELLPQDLTLVHKSIRPSRQGTHYNHRRFYYTRTEQNPAEWRLPHHSEAVACMPERATELLTHPPHAEALSIFIERFWDVILSVQ